MKCQNDIRLEAFTETKFKAFTETKFSEIVSGDCRAGWFIRTFTVGTELVSENAGIT